PCQPKLRILRLSRVLEVHDERVTVGHFAHDRNIVHDARCAASHRFDDGSSKSLLAARQDMGERVPVERGEQIVPHPAKEFDIGFKAELAHLFLASGAMVLPVTTDHGEWMASAGFG